jgi:hypothetical protein
MYWYKWLHLAFRQLWGKQLSCGCCSHSYLPSHWVEWSHLISPSFNHWGRTVRVVILLILVVLWLVMSYPVRCVVLWFVMSYPARWVVPEILDITMRCLCLHSNNGIRCPQRGTTGCQAPTYSSLWIGGYILLTEYLFETEVWNVELETSGSGVAGWGIEWWSKIKVKNKASLIPILTWWEICRRALGRGPGFSCGSL